MALQKVVIQTFEKYGRNKVYRQGDGWILPSNRAMING